MLRTAVLWVLSSVALAGSSQAAPLIHLQTDRPSYRLGETLWYRIHGQDEEELSVELLDAEGKVLSLRIHEAKRAVVQGKSVEREASGGSILIPRDIDGGTFEIVVRRGEEVLHRVPLEIYDLDLPKLDVDLTVLGSIHYPGEDLVASFRAVDMKGRPIVGARVENLLTLPGLRVRKDAGETNEDGRALIRVSLPATAAGDGHLAAGLMALGKEAAVAQAVHISSSVAVVDAFAEGGTIIAGWSQRLGLYFRGEDGQPAAAAGRVVDDRDESVAAFEANPYGLATVLVPHEKGRSYRLVIDRPSDVEKSFPLPGPSGHDFALQVDEGEKKIHVEVGGALSRSVNVRLVQGSATIAEQSVWLQSTRREAPCTATIELEQGERGGLADVILLCDGRIHARRSVYLGGAGLAPVRVSVNSRGGAPLLAGSRVNLELAVSSPSGPLVDADLAVSIYQGAPSDLPSLALRSAVGPYLQGHTVGAHLFRPDLEGPDRDAFLLVHHAHAFPVEGLDRELSKQRPLAAASRRRPTVFAPLRTVPAAHEDDGVEPGDRGKTVVRHARLERALDRSRYTRSIVDEKPAFDAVKLNVSPRRLLRDRQLGKIQRVPPQERTLSVIQVDSRRTLFWKGRVRTGKNGRARIGFRLNHHVSELTWVAEGYAGDRPVSGRGRLNPRAGFTTHFYTPVHLDVGDQFDVFLETEVVDGNETPIDVDFQYPSCLEPLLRTRMTFRPGRDPRMQRFRFKAVAPAERAAFRVVASRGLYRKEHLRPLRVDHREVELTNLTAGHGKGEQSFEMHLPPTVVPGSVRAHGNVMSGFFSESLSLASFSLRDLWRFFLWPSGCFEQFTSKNYLTLITLDGLKSADIELEPADLELAYKKALRGFGRLMKHARADGSFAMFSDGPGDVHATLVAIRHLALYDKHFGGRGRPRLETALRWLRNHDLNQTQHLYLTMSLHDVGREWRGSSEVVGMEPKSIYERALLANCLVRWPQSGEKSTAEKAAAAAGAARTGSALVSMASGTQNREEPPSGASERAAILAGHLDALEEALPTLDAALGRGTGLFGSAGTQLRGEVLALSALALHEGGREEAARRYHYALLSRWGRGWGSSQSTAMAIRSLSRLPAPPPPPVVEKMFKFDFGVAGLGVERTTLLSSRHPGRVDFGRELPERFDGDLRLTLDIRSDQEKVFQLGCSYRVADPVSSPGAPYRLTCRMDPILVMDSQAKLHVEITRAPEAPSPSSQTIARIALPGGCEVMASEMAEVVRRSDVSHWESSDGYVDLYWTTGEKAQNRSLDIPIIPRVEGVFRARPSVVYPYYESGKEYYADPLKVKVLNTFGATLDKNGRTTPPPGSPGSPLPLPGRR